jgi:hypothetical protein
MTPDQRTCISPPHPDFTGRPPGGEVVTEPALSRLHGWLSHAPAERVPLLGIPCIWAAAEALHLAHVPGLYPGAATATAAGLAFGLGEYRARNEEHIPVPGTRQTRKRERVRSTELATAAGVVGAWVTAAVVMGPLAGPYHLLSLAYGLGAAAGYWWLRPHQAIRGARQARDDAVRWAERKAGFHRRAPAWDLQGAHLLHWEELTGDGGNVTGERMLLDTRATSQRASSLCSRAREELIAEVEMLAAGRVSLTPDRIAGRAWLEIRRADQWAKPIPHPLTVKDSPWAHLVPYPATIRTPLNVGVHAPSGTPLAITLWDQEGGKVVLIAGKKGSGKTTLLNCLRERITACPDAVLIQINLAKALQEKHWAPLAAVTAVLARETERARLALQFSWAGIRARTDNDRDTATHVPTPQQPLFVVIIDEIDAAAAINSDPETGKAILGLIASKCRSEGWALVVAAQRATAEWLGGADVRANIDAAVYGKFSRSGEATHIAGSDYTLPDMGAYGENNAGVFAVTELPPTGEITMGRTFMLDDLGDIDRIAAARLVACRPYVLEPALAGQAERWAAITGTGPIEPGAVPAPTPGTAGTGDAQAVREKITQIGDRLSEPLPAIPPLPPEQEAELAAETDAAREVYLADYTNFALPEPDQAKLRTLIGQPGGISTRTAAEQLSCSHTYAHRQLRRWVREGTAERAGRGPNGRFRAIPSSAPAEGRAIPDLHAVPDPGEPGQPAAGEGTP